MSNRISRRDAIARALGLAGIGIGVVAEGTGIVGLGSPKSSGGGGGGSSQTAIFLFAPGVMAVVTKLLNANIYAPFALTITEVHIELDTKPSTGASFIADVNKNGTTIFTTQANRPTILTTGNDGTGIPDITSVAKNDILTIDIDQVGDVTPGSDFIVQIRFKVATV